MGNETPLIPRVLWAQRSDMVHLTFCVEDYMSPFMTIESQQIVFRSFTRTEGETYAITMTLFAEIDPGKSNIKLGRYVEVELPKLRLDEYWPRLTKDIEKHHWLKIDSEKRINEDDTDDKIIPKKKYKNSFYSKRPISSTSEHHEDDSDSDHQGMPEPEEIITINQN